MTVAAPEVAGDEAPLAASGSLAALFTSTDHKKIGMMTVGTATLLFFAMGALALVMRVQLAQPNQALISPHVYDQFFTIHGSGMIYLVITPFALGFAAYLVPLHVGAPTIAAPRTTLLGYWLYAVGAASVLLGFAVGGGAAADGWYNYPPLSNRTFSPGQGQDLWLVGVFLATTGMILISATVLWTALRMRAPGMTPLRMSVFTWSEIVTTMMVIGAFPALLAALIMLMLGRVDPAVFGSNTWVIGYQNVFWFYGHPVVYVMFFPFVGAVAEVLATFAGRRYSGYKPTVVSLLLFAALSMSVWGHHMFVSGQISNDYYSLTSISLSIPAGIEYFGFLATLVGGRIVYSTSMLFALAFIPQFLVGGLTGIMVGTPVLDYHFQGGYFVVAHFHYTLFAGSVFGLFAGIYFWWSKATGFALDERLGKLHFWLMVLGTNVTFLPMFGLGFLGLPRRVSTYPAVGPFGTLSLISTIGAFILGLAMVVFAVNVIASIRRRVPVSGDPWSGHTLEWATTSPPPRFNFASLPPIHSYAPLLDLREDPEEAVAPEEPSA